MKKDGRESYENIYSFLSPIHRKIGCEGFSKVNVRFVGCLLAPGVCPKECHPFYRNSYFEGFKGVSGSNCTAGYSNNDGLCALIPPTTTTDKPLTKPPGKPSSEANDKDSVGVNDVTSGSFSVSLLIGVLLLVVSFSYWF